MTNAGDPHATSAEPQANASAADLSGETFGDYRVLRRLGHGGMGDVYLAEQISLKRKVALKLLKPDLAANSTALIRFRLEAEAVARVTHANIVQVYACDILPNGRHFMALEYVEGRNLRQYLEKKGPPDILVALSIIRQVAAALQRASELGIIHRDIKPENILLTRKVEVKVADFGLSRCFADDAQQLHITQSGVTMGTPLYMSPEQVEGKPVDPRTDIYSFGVTCYHMMAGQPPFRGKTAFEVAVQHVQSEAPPLARIRPDLPAELCALIHKMMAKRPEDRFQTAREIMREASRLRDALVGAGATPAAVSLSLVAHSAVESPDLASTQSVTPLPARRWGRLVAVTLVLLALGGGLGYGWWNNRVRNAAHGTQAENVKEVGRIPPAELFENKDREKDMLAAVKLRTQPTTFNEVRAGLEDRIELGVLYLKERRLDEAEKFFKQLEAQVKVRSYHHLGQLGRAMILAFRNEPKESNVLFVKVLLNRDKKEKFDKGSPDGPGLWLRDPRLREMIAEALNFNFANHPGAFQTFPYKGLEKYRHPPTPKLKMGP